MEPFFSASEVSSTRAPLTLVPRCGACGLYKKCHSPKMPVWGKGKSKILVVGEAPGRNEDEQNRPFVGEAGQLLQDALREVGISLREDCWVTNSLICRPPGNQITNKKWVDYCRPNLVRAVEGLKPEKILLLGKTAVQSLVGWLWRGDVGPVSRWVGWKIPCQKVNAWVLPCWHPSFILRSDYGVSRRQNEVRELLFAQQLQGLNEVDGRPWEEVPGYEKRVRVVTDHRKVPTLLEPFQGKVIAFDFETDRLRPDHPDTTILSCAVSDGEVSIAYPLVGEAMEATKTLLFDKKTPKIGWNLKHEERWCLSLFGKGVRGWLYDGMLGTHVLDNRKLICSLKFQGFVRLGYEKYNDKVEGLMQAESTNAPNKLCDRSKLSLRHLLLYNGLDSLLTFLIAQKQMKDLGL